MGKLLKWRDPCHTSSGHGVARAKVWATGRGVWLLGTGVGSMGLVRERIGSARCVANTPVHAAIVATLAAWATSASPHAGFATTARNPPQPVEGDEQRVVACSRALRVEGKTRQVLAAHMLSS